MEGPQKDELSTYAVSGWAVLALRDAKKPCRIVMMVSVFSISRWIPSNSMMNELEQARAWLDRP
jgi:hypothetical protein